MHGVTNLRTCLRYNDDEAAMARAGLDRYHRRQTRLAKQGALAERDDYASVIKRSLLDVVDRFNELVDKEEERISQRGGKPSRVIVKVKDIEGATVAYITLATIFNSLTVDNDKNKIIMKVGSVIELESKFHFINEQNPELWKRLIVYAKERGSYRHKTDFVLNTAAKEGIEPEDWSLEDKALIGEALFRLVEEAGLVQTEVMTSGEARRCEVSLTPIVEEWLEDHRKRASEGALPMIRPVFAPMREPPLDWSASSPGGYKRMRVGLVKAAHNEPTSDTVYEAINLMQRTAWRINPVMLALVACLWAEGRKAGKLPQCAQQPVPPKMPEEEWAALDEEVKKGIKLRRRELHADNRQAKSDLVSIGMVLDQARELRHEPHIYIPYQLDFRGRAYCLPLLNPQGPDYIRALFEFAEGKPVGSRGAMWLAIQCASLWDGEYRGKRLSKSSFQARYDWAEENEDLLRNIVADPLSDRRWLDADKPYMFLRTAMDWVSYLDLGPDFVSHVPVALDGACSGIQHYSALLRDADGGARVNLTPSEEPRDVYQDVADAIIPMLEKDLLTNVSIDKAGVWTTDEAARWWLHHGVSRKVVKKPVMTYGYSSRLAGFTAWYDKEFVKPAFKQDNEERPRDPLARYLGRHTLTAVERLLPAVAAGMEWLMDVSGLLAHEGKPVTWTAPSGFRIVQAYTTGGSKRVETYLGGEKLRVSIPDASPRIDKAKQRSSISPNHTHSLDAAHLVFTVIRASRDYGIRNFALIHDSFGTLAADTDAMFSAVREAFVQMYEEHDPFQHLYEEAYNALSEAGRKKLKPPPAKGDLDISLVLQSLYAFA